jgi:predicted MFS family arabinose efflux permease
VTTAGPSPSAGAAATWRQAPGAAKALIIGTFINRMAGFLQIFVVLYLTARGFPAAQAAGALSIYGAGVIAGLLAGGWFADRLGVRQTIVISMAGSALLLLTVLYLSSYLAIVAAVGLVGAVSQAYRPAAAEMLSLITPPDRQVMIFSMQQLALNVGATSAPLLGIVLISVSYRLLFWGEAAAALGYAVIAAIVLPPARVGKHARRGWHVAQAGDAGPDADAGDGQRARGYLAVLTDWRYLVFLSAMGINAAVYAQYISTLPLFLRHRGLPTAVYGALLAFNSILVIAGQLPVTKVVQRWQPRTVAACGVLMIGGGMTLYAPAWGLAGLALATLTWSVAECVATPTMFFAYPARAAPAGLRGRYIGASQASFHLGYAAGPALGVLVWHQAGGAVWLWCGLGGVIAMLAALAGVRRVPGQTPPAGTVTRPSPRHAAAPAGVPLPEQEEVA